MSHVPVHDLTERARARAGRTYQVAALAPFPARPPLELWHPWRRPWVHPANDLDTGYGIGRDSNLLHRLKQGLAAEGIEQGTLDALTEEAADAALAHTRASATALAKLPPAVRDIITADKPPKKYQNWFFKKRPRPRLDDAFDPLDDTDNWQDAGGGQTAQVFVHIDNNFIGTRAASNHVPGPVRLTHIHVAGSPADSVSVGYAWSVYPPGVGESADSLSGADAIVRASGTQGPLSIPCNVLVPFGGIQFNARLTHRAAVAASALEIILTYNRLRRKASSL